MKRKAWFCIGAASILILLISSLLLTKNLVKPLEIIEYNGRYYEQLNYATIKDMKLPKTITADMLGYKLNTQGFNDTTSLYQYKAMQNDALLIASKNNQYKFYLFCNFVDSKTMKEISNVFGMKTYEDVKMIYFEQKGMNDPNFIKPFYDELVKLQPDKTIDINSLVYKKEITIYSVFDLPLTISYYPNQECIVHANSYFKIDKNFALLLDSL